MGDVFCQAELGEEGSWCGGMSKIGVEILAGGRSRWIKGGRGWERTE